MKTIADSTFYKLGYGLGKIVVGAKYLARNLSNLLPVRNYQEYYEASTKTQSSKLEKQALRGKEDKNKMDEKYIGRKIVYRNDALGEGTIKKVAVVRVYERDPLLAEVVDYPINENLNERIIFLEGKIKDNESKLEKSGERSHNGMISRREKRRLNHLLEKK